MNKIIFLLLFFLCFGVQAQEKSSFSQLTNVPKVTVGTSIKPLSEQTLQADGSVGIAYENAVPTVEDVKTEQKTKRYKRMRAVEREYTLPTDTFDSEMKSRIDAVSDTKFLTSTMSELREAVRKKNVRFVECSENDKTCQEYEVDDAGEVIWK